MRLQLNFSGQTIRYRFDTYGSGIQLYNLHHIIIIIYKYILETFNETVYFFLRFEGIIIFMNGIIFKIDITGIYYFEGELTRYHRQL